MDGGGQTPETPLGNTQEHESPEDAEIEKIDGAFSNIKGRLVAKAKEQGALEDLTGPTDFARSKLRITPDVETEILSTTDDALTAVTKKNTQRTPLPEQGKVKFLWETQGQGIIAHAIVPDPEKPHPGIVDKQLDAAFDTWGVHDVTLLLSTKDPAEPTEFELGVSFEEEGSDTRLGYRTGRKKLSQATDEEGEIMRYYLEHLVSTVSQA